MGQIPVYMGTTSAQFYVDKLSPIKGFIDEFIKKSLSEFEYDKVKHTYTFICDYVIRDEKTQNVIIPINFLPQLEDYLTAYGYSNVFKHVPLEPIQPRQSTIKPNPSWVPRENQVPIIDYLINDKRSRKGVSLATGGGKLLRNGTLVKVPGSWKKIEDIKIGDMVVAPDGKAYPVTGVYPHKNKQLYRVSFRDGRYLDAGADHLWEVLVNDRHHGGMKTRVLDTLEMIPYLHENKSASRIYVPLITPEDTPDVPLPLDPYLVGTLIANGCLTSGSGVRLSTGDPDVIKHLEKVAPAGCVAHRTNDTYDYTLTYPNQQNNPIKDALIDLGLYGHRAPEKFIPEIYMHASTNQRWELMRGLMDGDGTIGNRTERVKPKTGTVTTGMGSLSYSTSSTVLAKQIQELIWGFGDMCSLTPRWTHYTYKGERYKAHYPDNRLHIRAKKPSMYFKTWKKKHLADDNYQYARALKLRVDEIQPVDCDDATCIAIDSPNHTYVAENYITTHNTFIMNNAMARIGYVTMIITASNIAQWIKNVSEQTSIHENFTYLDDKNYNNTYKWVHDINAQCKEKGSKLWLIMGSDSLYQLANDGVMPDVFICSTATLRDFAECSDSYKNLPWTYQGFIKKYGIGTKIVDEAHQNFHAINRIDLISNIKNNFFATATFIKNGTAASRIFNIVYPPDMLFGNSLNEPYTNVTAYAYSGNVPAHFVKRKRGYNAIKYEQYLLKRPMWLKDYLEHLVLPEVYMHYVRKKHDGEKCLLFFATKDMIYTVRDYLNKELQKYGLTCKEKVGGTPDDVLNDPNYHVYIGTPGGMGTGRDIPHLRTAINFISIDSKVQVQQMFGRLRRIPGVDTEWVDNVDRMIDSQVRHFYTRDRFYKKQGKTYRKIKLS